MTEDNPVMLSKYVGADNPLYTSVVHRFLATMALDYAERLTARVLTHKYEIVDSSVLPDSEDIGINRILGHFYVPRSIFTHGWANRNADKKMATFMAADDYRNIGRMLHYIEDCCQPQHTTFNPLMQALHYSYEDWCERVFDDLTAALHQRVQNCPPLPVTTPGVTVITVVSSRTAPTQWSTAERCWHPQCCNQGWDEMKAKRVAVNLQPAHLKLRQNCKGMSDTEIFALGLSTASALNRRLIIKPAHVEWILMCHSDVNALITEARRTIDKHLREAAEEYIRWTVNPLRVGPLNATNVARRLGVIARYKFGDGSMDVAIAEFISRTYPGHQKHVGWLVDMSSSDGADRKARSESGTLDTYGSEPESAEMLHPATGLTDDVPPCRAAINAACGIAMSSESPSMSPSENAERSTAMMPVSRQQSARMTEAGEATCYLQDKEPELRGDDASKEGTVGSGTRSSISDGREVQTHAPEIEADNTPSTNPKKL